MSAATDRDRLARELERQQALVAALWRDDAAVLAWSDLVAQDAGVAPMRGLQAYRANAGAAAERALSAAFPVVRALVGTEAFAGLVRAFWQAEPPRHGDLATLADVLPGFIERDARLAEVPYLADVARLEAALARAESAADAKGSASARLASLALLAEHDPAELFIDLAPGAAVIRSAWPVATLWQAHRHDATSDAVAAAREAIAARRGECVYAWRPEWAARCEVVDAASAAFLEALIDGRSLAEAQASAIGTHRGWSFETWLARAIEGRWHGAARASPPVPSG